MGKGHFGGRGDFSRRGTEGVCERTLCGVWLVTQEGRGFGEIGPRTMG